MARPTADGVAALAVGMLAARAERGFVAIVVDEGPPGRALRRMLPVLLVTPLEVGWLCSGRNRQATTVPISGSC